MTAPPEDLRDRTRQQILDSLGGWSGTVVAAIPLVVFVIANAVTGLRSAIIAAVASAVVVAGYRMARRQPVQQALSGLVSVGIAAAIAGRTGQARGFFLLGIVAAFGYAALFALSLLVRRPLVGVLWEYLDPSPLPPGQRWHKLRELRRAYDVATAAVLAMFLARAVVQLSLFKDNRTGLLAVAKLVMGLPLYVAVVAVVFWVVRRARQRLGLRSPAVQSPGPELSTGLPGATVLPGADSATGLPGADGATELPGADGATELPGADSATGLPGADGATGLPGADSATELRGADSATELRGADSAPDGGLSLRKGDE